MRLFNDNKNKMISAISVLIISAAFFLGVGIYDGPIWCVDSESYASMHFSREPGYPLFLLALRKIFGENIYRNDQPVYLFWAVIFQSLLWIYATYVASMFVYKICEKREYSARKTTVLTLGALFFQFLTPILNRFLASRGSMYSESIMTESLAMPLFVLFCIRLTNWIMERDRRDFVLMIIEAFLIISIRSHMIIVLMLWLFASLVIDVLKKSTRNIKGFFIVCLAAILVFAGVKLFDASYNYVYRGIFHAHGGHNMTAVSPLYYTSDISDADLFTGDEKELFLAIYNECDAKGLLMNSVEGAGWNEMAEHYSENYGEIYYRIADPICHEYISNQHPELDNDHINLVESDLQSKMARKLLVNNMPQLMTLIPGNMLRAFVYSNSKVSPDILVYASYAMYALFILLFVLRLFGLRKEDKARAYIVAYSFVAIAGLAINAVLVGLVIYGQGRFMAYSTGLFYTAMMLMMLDVKSKAK